jgi:hypothetical protein
MGWSFISTPRIELCFSASMKEPNPVLGSNRSPLASAAGPARASDPRLQAAGNDQLVCRLQYTERESHGP